MIQLHGALAEQFGDNFKLDVKSPAEAVRALEANFPGEFYQAFKDGYFRVGYDRDSGIDTEFLTMETGAKEIHFEPVIVGEGGRNANLFKIVLGLAVIGAAVYFSGGTLGTTAFSVLGSNITYGNIALFGVGLVLQGVAGLLTPVQQLKTGDEIEDENSYLFDGPVNTIKQGGPVPIVYGRHIVGSTLVSASIYSADYDESERAGNTVVDLPGGSEGISETNPDLVARAGVDQDISRQSIKGSTEVVTVALNGSGSTLAGGAIDSYRWEQLSGPSFTTLLNSNLAMSTFSTSGLPDGDYVFNLVINDTETNSLASDEVTIKIRTS